MVQWLRKTSPSSAVCAGLTPGQGAKIPHAAGPKKNNIKKKQYCNKFNKDFKNGPHQKKKSLKRKNSFKKKKLSVTWRHEELNLGEKGRTQNYAIISQ